MKWTLRIEEEHKDIAEIPVSFYHILSTQCGAAQIFKGCGGPAWDIVIRRTKVGNMIRGMYIEGGWKEFILDNDIEVGDTLVMYYKGRGIFHTQIFSYHGHDKTYVDIPVTQTIVTRRRLPLNAAELELHLRQMQAERPEPSFTYIFDVRCIHQGSIVVPVPFSRMHFSEAGQCTVVLLRHRSKQWCAELQIVREQNMITSCKLSNGVNMFYEHACVVAGLGALVIYRQGYPLLFELLLGSA
ncbi:uncharacterized protein LOC110724111 [Chenopodium quinoa]|uniref:uncharacterized protein LOC110724111 n=1 Tax=Chenopodium quinoa TaxID=63459 RepID=UPI000B76F916|nr:uncharacterized protein LOC110724111 [Chenopodium quinoa]